MLLSTLCFHILAFKLFFFLVIPQFLLQIVSIVHSDWSFEVLRNVFFQYHQVKQNIENNSHCFSRQDDRNNSYEG